LGSRRGPNEFYRMSDPVIAVENLSKRYVLGHQRSKDDGLRHVIESALSAPVRWLRSRREEQKLTREEFWALQGVSFEVQRGEVVGLIGRNGAGKSTLLKLLSRITEPTTGRIQLEGRVASLLEVGTGFHPELTGRENIFLNGAILGMSKEEIHRKFDEIVAFSEIEKFLDTPVKRYSSGMYVRLAFSVAAHLDPEIMIVDEVLAVGDVTFQKKCFGKLEEAHSRSRTVLFVSHNLAAVESFCTRGIVMDRGRVAFNGPCKDAIQFYLDGLRGNRVVAHEDVIDLETSAGRPDKYRPRLKQLKLYDGAGRPLGGNIAAGGSMKAEITVELEAPTASVDAELSFFTPSGERVCTAHSAYEPDWSKDKLTGLKVFTCEISSLPILPGEYKINVGLDIALQEADYVDDATRLTVLQADYYGTGIIPTKGAFLLSNRWKIGADGAAQSS
jgi:lipopolysaccharide transport system ATP-binding protein